MYYLDFGTFSVIGASPEVMLQCKDNIQTLRPIAGTRKRGANAQEDRILEQELLEDEKENAEHLMLVDLRLLSDTQALCILYQRYVVRLWKGGIIMIVLRHVSLRER